MYCQLGLNDHSKISNEMAKNVSIMNRVNHLYNSRVIYSVRRSVGKWIREQNTTVMYVTEKQPVGICKHVSVYPSFPPAQTLNNGGCLTNNVCAIVSLYSRKLILFINSGVLS